MSGDLYWLDEYPEWVDQLARQEVELLALAPEPEHAFGHVARTSGCGGCDPAAIDFVLLDDGIRRRFDPQLDLEPP